MKVFSDLFRNTQKLEPEKRMARRKAIRKTEIAIDKTSDRIREYTRLMEKAVQKAVEMKIKGEQNAYKRELISIRRIERTFNMLYNKRRVQERILMEIHFASNDQEFLSAVNAFNQTLTLNVGEKEDSLLDLWDNIKENSGGRLIQRIENELTREAEKDADKPESEWNLEDLDREISQMADMQKAEQQSDEVPVKSPSQKKSAPRKKKEAEELDQLMEERRNQQ